MTASPLRGTANDGTVRVTGCDFRDEEARKKGALTERERERTGMRKTGQYRISRVLESVEFASPGEFRSVVSDRSDCDACIGLLRDSLRTVVSLLDTDLPGTDLRRMFGPLRHWATAADRRSSRGGSSAEVHAGRDFAGFQRGFSCEFNSELLLRDSSRDCCGMRRQHERRNGFRHGYRSIRRCVTRALRCQRRDTDSRSGSGGNSRSRRGRFGKEARPSVRSRFTARRAPNGNPLGRRR